jgi:glycosyltransferase involved in cell wall biosynthesis
VSEASETPETSEPAFPIPAGAPRVALVSDWFLPRIGGVEYLVRDLANQLRVRGIDARVLTPIPGPRIRGGVPVHHLSGFRAPIFNFLSSPLGLRRIRTVLQDHHFDLVHAQGSIICPTAWAGASWGESLGLPTVVSFHSELRHFRLPLKALDLAIGWRSWRAQFTGVSRKVAGEMDALLQGPPRMRAIPNATDVDFWRPRTGRIGSGDPKLVRIVSVMRLQPRKRPLPLMRIIQQVRSRLPLGTRLELVLVGAGDEAALVQRSIRRRGLGDVVQLRGHLSREEIRDLHHTSDIFVLPSFLESFGIAALEARAAGVPVVAMAQGGVKEFVTHGVNGLLSGGDQEMVTHLLRLIRNPREREAMAAANRKRPSRWDWSVVVREYLDLYRDAGLELPEDEDELRALA